MLATGQFCKGKMPAQAGVGTWLLSRSVSGAMGRRLALQHAAARNFRNGPCRRNLKITRRWLIASDHEIKKLNTKSHLNRYNVIATLLISQDDVSGLWPADLSHEYACGRQKISDWQGGCRHEFRLARIRHAATGKLHRRGSDWHERLRRFRVDARRNFFWSKVNNNGWQFCAAGSGWR